MNGLAFGVGLNVRLQVTDNDFYKTRTPSIPVREGLASIVYPAMLPSCVQFEEFVQGIIA